MNRQVLIELLQDAMRAGNWPDNTDGTVSGTLERPAEREPSDLYNLAYDAYCGSLDAAKVLHETVLPSGEGWKVYRTSKRPGMIPGSSPFKYSASAGYGRTHTGNADDPARAWLLAILEALIQEGGSDE